MEAIVVDAKQNVFRISIGELQQRLPEDCFFWLDIDGASAEELKTVSSILHIDEETGAWLMRCGKRARFDNDKSARLDFHLGGRKLESTQGGAPLVCPIFMAPDCTYRCGKYDGACSQHSQGLR